MSNTNTWTLPPTVHLEVVREQRNEAADEAAIWKAIAQAEREKVESLTAEVLRQAKMLDALAEDSNALE